MEGALSNSVELAGSAESSVPSSSQIDGKKAHLIAPVGLSSGLQLGGGEAAGAYLNFFSPALKTAVYRHFVEVSPLCGLCSPLRQLLKILWFSAEGPVLLLGGKEEEKIH